MEQSRTRLRARLKEQPAPPPWRPPTARDLEPGRPVLAWDATLTNCAWALMAAGGDGVVIYEKGTIRPRTALTGYRGTWDKATQLRDAISAVTDRVRPADVVLEAPSVGGGYRVESSLMAGFMVWSMDPGNCHDVSATRVSAVMLGEARVRSDERKKRIRAAVIELVPEAAGRGYNEHIRDSIATGVTWLWDLKAQAAP